MKGPRETKYPRRHHSCPPNLKLCREYHNRSRGHFLERLQLLRASHPREGAIMHTHHNTAASLAPVQRPESRQDRNAHAKNRIPQLIGRGTEYTGTLGIGPYWNPPRTAASNTPTTSSWANGPKMTDCEWINPETAAATTSTKVAPLTTTYKELKRICAEADAAHVGGTKPTATCGLECSDLSSVTKRQHRQYPRRTRSGYSSDASLALLSPRTGIARVAAANDKYHYYDIDDEHARDISKATLHRANSDSSIPSSYSSRWSDPEHEIAAWDPYWDHAKAI